MDTHLEKPDEISDPTSDSVTDIIVLPVAGGRLCMHFGHCETFAMVSVDVNSQTIISTESITPSAEPPEKVVKDYLNGILLPGRNACDH